MTEIKEWHLLIMLIVGLLGYFGNSKYIMYLMHKAIEPVKNGLEKLKNEVIFQGEIINAHGKQLDRYNDNVAFYKSIELTIQEALKYLKDDREEASTVLNDIGNRVRDLAKDLINLDIEKIKDEMVRAKCVTNKSQTKDICCKLLGKEFTKGFMKKYVILTTKYSIGTCKISENWVNDKNKRFRTITSSYVEDVVTHFINYFKDNRELIKYPENSKK